MTLARLGGFAFLIVAMTLQSLAQVNDVLIDVNFNNVPLGDVFRYINKTYPVNINFYEDKVTAYTVKANIKHKSVSEALEKMLKDTDLIFERLGNSHQYLITSRKSSIEEIALTGKIIDKKTSAGISQAYILSKKNPRLGAYASTDGSFALSIPYQADDTLLIGQLNYHVLSIPLKALYEGGHRMPLIIPLLEKENELDLVKIQDKEKKQLTDLKPLVEVPTTPGNFEFDPTRLGYLVGLGEADILRTLQTLPGISSLGENAGDLNIRGGAAEENLILFDGITIYQTDHLLGLIGSVNTKAIQKVKLYSSGYDARFGGRTGGVIEMDGKPTKSSVQHSGVSSGVNILNYSGHTQVPFDNNNGAFVISGRSSFSGIIETRPFQRIIEDRVTEGLVYRDLLTRDTSSALIQPSYTFFDINGKAKWLIGKKDILSFSFLKGRDNLNYVFQDATPSFSRKVDHNLKQSSSGASLGWNHYWGNDVVSKTRVVYSGFSNRYGYRLRDILQDGTIVRGLNQRNELHDWSFQNHTTWQINKNHTLEGGIQVQYLDVINEERETRQDSLVTHRNNNRNTAWVPSIYVQDKWTKGNRLSITYGGRYTYHIEQDQHLIAPRASMEYLINEKWSLKLAGGRYYQYLRQVPYINDLGLGENFWMLSGTDSLPILRSNHLQGGFAYQVKHWMLGLEVYGKQLSGLTTSNILYDPRLFNFFPDTSNTFTDGRGNTLGLDLFAKYQRGPYTGWISYSLARTRYQFDEVNEGQPFLADQDRRHMVKIVNMMKWDKFELSAIFMWLKGNPVTEITKVSLIPASGGLLLPRFSEERNGARLPDYHRLDLTAAWTLIQREELRAKMGIAVFNAYNRSNVKDWIPANPSANGPNGSTNYLTARELLGISPNLFINLDF